jgi:AraC-like DNA-binding protein
MIQNLILIIAGLIGFVTAGLSLKNHKLNNAMNIYIIVMILIISIRYFILGIMPFVIGSYFKSYNSSYSNFPLVVIPLFYLYVKKLSNSSIPFEKKELLHFIFPVFFFFFIINLDFLKIDFQSLRFVSYTIFTSYLFYYTFRSYSLLKRNVWIKKNGIKVVGKQNASNSQWTYFLFLAIIIIEFRLLLSIFLEIKYGIIMRGYSFLWISAIIWLFILIKILISPEILYGYNALHKKIDENRNSNLNLSSIWNTNSKKNVKNVQHLQLKEKIKHNILSYIEEIEKISNTDKIFRDPTITMVDLANKLNIPKSHISYLFKYHSTISFSEYKKAIRIQDAIHLINEDYLKGSTLDYLSKKVGFPSYNTFFTSFLSITGFPPQKYIDQLNE